MPQQEGAPGKKKRQNKEQGAEWSFQECIPSKVGTEGRATGLSSPSAWGFFSLPSPQYIGGGVLQHLANWNWPARETWLPFLVSAVFLEGLTTAHVLFGDMELWHK
jgi:hypothetical protein